MRVFEAYNKYDRKPATAKHTIGADQYGRKEWTVERISHCKMLWREGFSANQISRALGGVSRNAVIGKMHREKMPGHMVKVRTAPPKVKRVLVPRDTIPKIKPIGNQAFRALFAPDAPPVPEVQELVIPLAERKTVETLENCSCRWPIGDPRQADFHFCGKGKVASLPYCEFHARRAFRPPLVKPEQVKPMLTLSRREGVPQLDKEFDHA
jgi:GcrA cell cycle regulator